MVTPLAGVWIEIQKVTLLINEKTSLPLRECGLKYLVVLAVLALRCHSPCGSVD